MSRRRLALKLAACALAGVVMTLAVAWGCVCRAADPDIAYAIQKGRMPVVDLRGNMVEPRRWHAPRSWPPLGRLNWRSERFGVAVEEWDCDTPEGHWRMELMQVGFPFRSLAAARGWHGAAYAVALDRSFSTGTVRPVWERWRLSSWLEARPVPLRPIWPGFALDTAFYGTIVFLLWSAPGIIRRRARKRRGRCPACGYDLRGSSGGPCPECGA